MIAPVIIRNFDAVEVATEDGTFYLNRRRLELTIQIMSTPIFDDYDRSAVELHRRFPSMSASEIFNYIKAAQACIDHEVKP